MRESGWNYVTPGIPDALFERLPGIPLSPAEVRVLILSQLRLRSDSIVWDVGAGTGTIAVESGLLCAAGKIIAIERDADVADLINRNCQKFAVKNVEVQVGLAPECLTALPDNPDRICVEGGQDFQQIITYGWGRLPIGGRMVAIAATLDGLHSISHTFTEIGVRNPEVVQSGANRLEPRGNRQVFAAVNPLFILSGEKTAES